jgi:hypothetical protein
MQGPSQDKDTTIRKLCYIFLSCDQTSHNNQPFWHKTLQYQGKKGFYYPGKRNVTLFGTASDTQMF